MRSTGVIPLGRRATSTTTSAGATSNATDNIGLVGKLRSKLAEASATPAGADSGSNNATLLLPPIGDDGASHDIDDCMYQDALMPSLARKRKHFFAFALVGESREEVDELFGLRVVHRQDIAMRRRLGAKWNLKRSYHHHQIDNDSTISKKEAQG